MSFIELNSKFYAEKSVFDVLELIEWKRKSNKYNFKILPKTAILTLQKSFLDKRKILLSKKIKGITGKNYKISNSLLVCTSFGVGAPAITNLLEELRGLGVENFIFIGFAGRLNSHYKENEICIVKKAYSTTGCTSLYSKNEFFEPKKNHWFTNLNSTLDYKNSICWSTDGPFRETSSLLRYFIQNEASHVDMECAAIYAFAEYYDLNALCIVVSSDSLENLNWKPPSGFKSLNYSMRKVLKSCIDSIENGK